MAALGGSGSLPARPPQPGQLPFAALCDLFDSVRGQKCGVVRQRVQRFVQDAAWDGAADSFQLIRLLIPATDFTRRYFAAQKTLAKALVSACGLGAKSAQAVSDWQKAGPHPGEFPESMHSIVYKGRCPYENGSTKERLLTVAEVNEALDDLATATHERNRAGVLTSLMLRTSPRMMYWITSIVLKDLKLGFAAATVLDALHPDAAHLYSLRMDLQLVCERLNVRTERLPRQDIVLGKAAQPQLSLACFSPEDALRHMEAKEFICETKFDGERMQLHAHADGSLQLFSRRGREHCDWSCYDLFAPAVEAQLVQRPCILDGELVVYNKTRRVFEPFSGIHQAVTAARDKTDPEEVVSMARNGELYAADDAYMHPQVKELEVVYVCWDILYVEDTSVISRPLTERHALLREAVQDAPAAGIPIGRGLMTARIALLLPDQQDFLGGPPASHFCRTAADISDHLENAIRLQEEGIVLKAPSSRWQPNDRSGAWLKLKPDYIKAHEIDAVIIGVYWAGVRRGAQYLMGLIKAPPGDDPDANITFVSFCRVGTGLTCDERQLINDQLAPLLQERQPGVRTLIAQHRGSVAVGGIEVAADAPDLWVTQPLQSVVLQLKGDIRLTKTRTYATGIGLRFPICTRVRWDKAPRQADTVASLSALAANATSPEKKLFPDGEDDGRGCKRRRAREAAAKRRRRRGLSGTPKPGKRTRRIVDHLQPADLAHVQAEGDALAQLSLLVDLTGPERREAETLVRRLGGKVPFHSWAPGVTHVIAEPGSWQCRTHAAAGRNVISPAWLQECTAARVAVPLRPRHHCHMCGDAAAAAIGDGFDARLAESVAPEDLEAIMCRSDIGAAAAAAAPAAATAAQAAAKAAPKANAAAMTEVEWACSDVGVSLNCGPFSDCSVAFLSTGATAAGSRGGSSISECGSVPPDATLAERGAAEAAAAAAALEPALLSARQRGLSAQVRLGGGSVVSPGDASATHLVILRPPSIANAPLTPCDLRTALLAAGQCSAGGDGRSSGDGGDGNQATGAAGCRRSRAAGAAVSAAKPSAAAPVLRSQSAAAGTSGALTQPAACGDVGPPAAASAALPLLRRLATCGVHIVSTGWVEAVAGQHAGGGAAVDLEAHRFRVDWTQPWQPAEHSPNHCFPPLPVLHSSPPPPPPPPPQLPEVQPVPLPKVQKPQPAVPPAIQRHPHDARAAPVAGVVGDIAPPPDEPCVEDGAHCSSPQPEPQQEAPPLRLLLSPTPPPLPPPQPPPSFAAVPAVAMTAVVSWPGTGAAGASPPIGLPVSSANRRPLTDACRSSEAGSLRSLQPAAAAAGGVELQFECGRIQLEAAASRPAGDGWQGAGSPHSVAAAGRGSYSAATTSTASQLQTPHEPPSRSIAGNKSQRGSQQSQQTEQCHRWDLSGRSSPTPLSSQHNPVPLRHGSDHGRLTAGAAGSGIPPTTEGSSCGITASMQCLPDDNPGPAPQSPLPRQPQPHLLGSPKPPAIPLPLQGWSQGSTERSLLLRAARLGLLQ